jgi:beta-galactosidase
VADNIYHGTQDHYDGSFQALQTDFSPVAAPSTNFLVTETNAQTIGWTSGSQFPPYDGQLREDVYTYLANGANMVEYWHWASIRQPGDLLEGHSLARPGAESRVRRGEPDGA